MPNINKEQLRNDWIEKGAIKKSYPLMNKNLIPKVLKDMPMYQMEIARNNKEGLFRVPYILTENIINLANDPNIIEVVSAALGTNELIMWGPNLQVAVPYTAGTWHTDVESWLWPTVTLVMGLEGCKKGNSTMYIPYTHKLPMQPWKVADNHNSEMVIKAARLLDERIDDIKDYPDFEDGTFYIFDAKCWHAGNRETSNERKLLFMHYSAASDPRIPYMNSYDERTWFDFPASYIKIGSKNNFEVNEEIYDYKDKEYHGIAPENFGFYK